MAASAGAGAGAATIHVSARAREAGGTTVESLAAAVEMAQPGDTIIVGKGIYRSEERIRLDKPGLKVMGVSGEEPLLIGGHEQPNIIIAADRVVLQDLHIQGGFYGIKLDVPERAPNTRGVTIRNCTIAATAADCIKGTYADELTIEGCRIGPSGAKQKDNAEGIDLIGSLGVVIRGCRIEQVTTNGIYLKGGTTNGLVERCLVRRAGHSGILLGQDTDSEFMRDGAHFEAINCVARNNVVVETEYAGVGAYSAKNVRFISNTLLEVAKVGQAGLWVVTNSRSVPTEQVYFHNNIVVVAGNRPVVFVKDAVGLPDANHNLYFCRAGAARFVREITGEPTLDRQWTFEQWQKVAGLDPQSREAEALVDQKDYRLQPRSPAIAAGEAVAGVDDDFYGLRREKLWDIGAVMFRAR
jgi:hypothetical protein